MSDALNPLFGLVTSPTLESLDERQRRIQEDLLGLNKNLSPVASDVLTLSWDGVATSPQIAIFQHNLGYVPIPLAYFDNGGNKQNIPYYELAGPVTVGSATGALVILALEYLCDEVNFQVVLRPFKTPRPPLTLSIRYYLLREPSQA